MKYFKVISQFRPCPPMTLSSVIIVIDWKSIAQITQVVRV